MPHSYISDALKLGLTLSGHQDRQLRRYEEFLAEEAVAGGGIGPDEVERLRDRHILDSLIYAVELPVVPKRLLDVGSGVGLPGIPIAIARPELWVTLLDRSQRRTDLAGRACRILGLDSVTRITADVDDLTDTWDYLVFRGSLRIPQAADRAARLLEPDGQALVGVSRLADSPEVPQLPATVSAELTEASRSVLDSPFWLLRMTVNRK